MVILYCYLRLLQTNNSTLLTDHLAVSERLSFSWGIDLANRVRCEHLMPAGFYAALVLNEKMMLRWEWILLLARKITLACVNRQLLWKQVLRRFLWVVQRWCHVTLISLMSVLKTIAINVFSYVIFCQSFAHSSLSCVCSLCELFIWISVWNYLGHWHIEIFRAVLFAATISWNFTVLWLVCV